MLLQTMAHPDADVVRGAYEALNRGDIASFMDAFAEDAVWHGAGQSIQGRERIGGLVAGMRELAEGTLRIDLHDVVATDEHVVVLQVTRATRAGRTLADRVVYVYHLEDGGITEAFFSGDPRVQDEFWS